MYLPQYHPIPENDKWWGEGFTEWTNVKKSTPRFAGHYQPHIPRELGYYDLRDRTTRVAQAELAKSYGIHGFCYYHYWFNGKRLLEHPFNEVMANGEPDFPFCLCWANENWTRRWDGSEHQILIEQKYSDQDSLDFINSLIPAFRDSRYIRVNGRPLFLVYRTSLLPNPKRTAEIWREAMAKEGLEDLYLVRVENSMDDSAEPAPADIGFDAAMEFAPYWRCTGNQVHNLNEMGLKDHEIPKEIRVHDYARCLQNMLAKPQPNYKLFRGAFPCWDNSARRMNNPLIFVNSSPELYAYWIATIGKLTLETLKEDEQLIFVNAWNEWGEGCHLEPDEHFGIKFLEAHNFGQQLACDYFYLSNQVKSISGDLLYSSDRWFNLLRQLYNNDGIKADKLQQLAAFLSIGGFLQLDDSNNEEIKKLYNSITIKEEEIMNIYNSVSWKITAPLRKIYEMLFM